MAPEVLQGRYSILSDVYGFGATMYHLLCGEPPQEQPESLGKRFRDVTKKNPIVPPELNELIGACVENRPSDRPQFIDELLAAGSGISRDLLSAEAVAEGRNNDGSSNKLARITY